MKIHLFDLKTENNKIKKRAFSRIGKMIKKAVYIGGKEVENFEKRFAKFVGAKYAIGVASGTDALRTALLAAGINKSDEVILGAMSYSATALAVAHSGATPIFVDTDKFGNIDSSLVENKISPKTRVILAIHMYGRPCDMDSLKKISKKHNLILIDDCSHAHGGNYKKKKIGNLADISCFSLYPTKNLGAWGDAGIITTNSKGYADKAKLFREYGEKNRNYSEVIGYNSKMDPIQAIVVNLKLNYLKNNFKNRHKIANNYYSGLKNTGDIEFMPLDNGTGYHLFPIITNKRDSLGHFLKSKGIDSGSHYPLPLHLHPCFSYLGYKKKDLPVSEKLADTVLTLPIYPYLSKDKQNSIIKTIKVFFSNKN